MLDEATNGLDPESSFQFKKYLREFCLAGGTVLFSSHIVEMIEHLCDRIFILHQGQIMKEITQDQWSRYRDSGSSLEQEFIRLVREADRE